MNTYFWVISMKTILHTPSHNIYFDTLIMYGITLPALDHYCKVYEEELLEEEEIKKLIREMFKIEFTGREFTIHSNLDILVWYAIVCYIAKVVDQVKKSAT